jgi:hypothetical protein
VCALCGLVLFGAPAFSQQRMVRGVEQESIHENGTTESTTGAANTNGDTNAPVHHDSEVRDWTHDHLLYPRFGPMKRLIELQNDPRAIQHWQEGYRKDYGRWRGHEKFHGEHHNRPGMHRDWSISIGGNVDVAMFPAKWGLDPNQPVTGPANTGSCLTDYLVVPVDNSTTGIPTAAGQPDIVGFNNLYSGTPAPAGGLCDRAAAGVTDDAVSATAMFAYAIIGDDGNVTTSPSLSMDGTRIAFVEQGTGNAAARFHVLAFHAGDGVNTTVTGPDQDVFTFVTTTITTFSATAPAAGSGQVTDLQLGATAGGTTDTFSSPFIDYTDDWAYVGTDNGLIYRIKNVFCPTWAPCPGAAAPSIDTNWGGTGFVTLGTCGGAVTGVVVRNNVFAGCSDGNLYGFDPTGAPISGSPLIVGDGVAPTGGINDPPVIDLVNGWVYTESVNAGTAVVVQASATDLTVNTTATLLGPMTVAMHAPAFNDAYFSGPAANALLYEYSSNSAGVLSGDATDGEFILWGIGFTAGVMTAGTPNDGVPAGQPTNALAFSGATLGHPEISPITEFLTAGGEDRLFASALAGFAGNLVSFDLNDLGTNPGGFPVGQVPGFPLNGVESNATEGTLGTSGIVIDNSSNAANANSLYFGVLQGGTVVKLTQSAFQ